MESEIAVKAEPNDIDDRLLRIIQENESGISDPQLQSVLPDVDTRQRVESINKLLSTGRITLLKSGKNLLYKIKKEADSPMVPGGDNQEQLLYQIITEAGNKGIWIRDIRFKSNLLLTQVNKILRSLEGKKMIKAVKSVNASKKKVYMLYDLQPDRSVTGGAWYSDQDFESEFVDVLTNQCHRFLQNKLVEASKVHSDPIGLRNASYASGNEICEYITALGISKIELSVEDLEMILNTLIYDSKVEKTVDVSKQRSLYRAVNPVLSSLPMASTPCGVCPVFSQCEPGGTISPTTCIYLNDWLKF